MRLAVGMLLLSVLALAYDAYAFGGHYRQVLLREAGTYVHKAKVRIANSALF